MSDVEIRFPRPGMLITQTFFPNFAITVDNTTTALQVKLIIARLGRTSNHNDSALGQKVNIVVLSCQNAFFVGNHKERASADIGGSISCIREKVEQMVFRR